MPETIGSIFSVLFLLSVIATTFLEYAGLLEIEMKEQLLFDTGFLSGILAIYLTLTL